MNDPSTTNNSDPPPPPNKGQRPRRRWGVWGVAAVILATAGYLVFERLRGQSHFETLRNHLRERGEPVALEPLIPPPIPENQNAFVALMAIARRLEDFSGDEFPPSYRIVGPGIAVPGYRVEALDSRMQMDAGAVTDSRGEIDVDALKKALEREPLTARRPVAWTELAKRWEATGVSVPEITAALELPYFRSSFTFTNGFEDDLQYLIHLKHIGVFLSAHTKIELHRGEMEAATASLAATWNLSHRVLEEPLLISQLVGIAIGHIADNDAWAMLAGFQPDPDTLKRLLNAADSAATQVPQSMRLERAINLNFFLNPLRTLSGVRRELADLRENDYLGVFPDLGMPDWAFKRLYVPIYWFAWRHQDAALVLARWNQLIAELERRLAGYWNESSPGGTDGESLDLFPGFPPPSNQGGWYDRWKHPLSHTSALSAESLARNVFRFRTSRALTQTALALHLNRAHQGNFPTSLAALVPEELPEIPIDPMDGKPLRYRLESDATFNLWSVGLDGVDAGGSTRPVPEDGWQTDPWNWPDLVWMHAVNP